MGELNDKLRELSKNLVGLHVKDVVKKNKGLKLRDLSSEEKEKIKKLFHDLEEQVNEFVKKTKKEAAESLEEAEEKAKKVRTTLRDKLGKNKN
ncbi:hypothetical protein ACFYKX_16965 [Cytobacillus sp. FJAT-54145]|uniref:Phasin family protein n=1 Tax=Cytobacillus spartinae TaxID=3299023 RepID=A0ABW6KDN2_9BACI